MHDEKELKWFDKIGEARPTSEPHGEPDEIRGNLKKLMPDSWHMEGNKLIGQTEMGELVQHLPTDYICTGTDSKGLPKLKKVV